MIKAILDEMNQENGSNFKISVVKKHLNNKLFQRVISMTLDKVRYTFGVSMKNVSAGSSENTKDLSWGLDNLLPLVKREITGNAAINQLEIILESMSENDREIIEKIIGRDLKVRLGKNHFNKLLDKEYQITRPPYQRCDIGTEANVKKNINFKNRVFSEVKMDGTYRAATIDTDNITVMSRSGQEDQFPIIEKELQSLEIDGYTFLGEMTLEDEQDRAKGNGIINSITEREEKQNQIIFTVWDMVPASEYSMTKEQIKVATKAGTLSKYGDRLDKLETLLKDKGLRNVRVIEYIEVNSMKEAYEHFQVITKRGDEGTVIKTEEMVWKDGTSKQQLKCKLIFEIDARIVGFIEGKKGTVREKTFGSLMYETDDGLIKGSVSGLTDKILEDFNSRREELIGQVIEIEANDLTKSRDSETYALSHPRFITLRDKDTTDTLERAKQSLESSMNIT